MILGNGIINADGELWRIQRKAGLRFFNNANLKTFINDILPPVLADTKHDLDKASDTDVVLDLQQILLELTTRLMGKMAYDVSWTYSGGKCRWSLRANNAQMDMHGSLPFSKAFDFASGETTNRFTNPFWKIKRFLLGGRFRNAVGEVHRFGQRVVAEAVAKRPTKDSKSEAKQESNCGTIESSALQGNLINSLLDHLPSEELVADAAMNFLSAGRDTTAQSLTWAFYTLMRHPSFINPIRIELASLLPKQSSPSHSKSSLNLSFDLVQPTSLPYTQAVFNEVIRLYPPVPLEIKEVTAGTNFPDGTFLPVNSVVIWAPWAMGRSTLIWGDDATHFKPERWLEYVDNPVVETMLDNPNNSTIHGHESINKVKAYLVTKSAYENPVFNAGPRTCLGKKMAELLAVYVISALVWDYDFEEVLDKKKGGCGIGGVRVSQDSLTLPMKGGLPCRVRRRLL